MSTCEQIGRAALGEPTKRAGAELLWHCPNHDDRHESLSVNPRKNVFLCGPCNASGTPWQFASFLARLDPGDKVGVTAWFKEHGLLNGNQSARAASGRGPCVAEYVYADANRHPMARKLRFEPGLNGRKKDFAWQRWENEMWIDGLADIKTPLYRLPEIQSQPFVILTEGEKDADAGAKIELPTTTSGGTGTFRPDHAEMLRGKDVVIVADADDPGRQHAQRVAAMIHGKASSIKVCEIPASKDLAEAIEKGVPKGFLLALFEDPSEWKPPKGCEILDFVLTFIRGFLALSDSQARVVSLFAAHAHALDAADCTPYLSVNSAEKQSGKTRVLEVLETLVREPWLTGRVSAAVLTRKINAVSPTLLLDESDAAFGCEKEYAEALRGILNTGYRRGGVASCCVRLGANISYTDFATFCPKAIAGIGRLPDTVADRSIPIRLKRARRGEVQRFRKREVEREASEIKARLTAWCATNLETLRDARPDIPPELSDRQADCCEPLLAIADLAGGEWPETARRALIELCDEAQADDQSTGVRLLADVDLIFGEKGVDRISSEALVEALAGIETSAWGELSKGKPITKSKLAHLLGRFEITPNSVRFSDGIRKGYMLAWFQEAFSLYLPLAKRNNGTSRTNIDENTNLQNGTGGLCSISENARTPNKNGPCSGVPVSMPGRE